MSYQDSQTPAFGSTRFNNASLTANFAYTIGIGILSPGGHLVDASKCKD